MRIKVENPGKYTLGIINDFTMNDAKSYTTLAFTADSDGAVKSGGYEAVTKVSVAEAGEVFNLKVDSLGKLSVDATATSRFEEATEVGLYDSASYGTKSSFNDFVLDVKEVNSEYFVIFDFCDKSFEANSKTWQHATNIYNCYQMFLLSGITLTPVPESAEETAMKAAIAPEVTETGLSDTATVNVYTRDIDGETSVQSATKYNPAVGLNLLQAQKL